MKSFFTLDADIHVLWKRSWGAVVGTGPLTGGVGDVGVILGRGCHSSTMLVVYVCLHVPVRLKVY